MTSLIIQPLLAANAAVYAIQNATIEGKITVLVLLVLSLFSWTIIITKFRQLLIARKATKEFFAAYNSTRDPLDIQRKGEEFEGAPAYQLYIRGADELAYQLKNNPVAVQSVARYVPAEGRAYEHRFSGQVHGGQNQHGVVRGGEGDSGGGGRCGGDGVGKGDDRVVHGGGRRARSSGCWARCGASCPRLRASPKARRRP